MPLRMVRLLSLSKETSPEVRILVISEETLRLIKWFAQRVPNSLKLQSKTKTNRLSVCSLMQNIDLLEFLTDEPKNPGPSHVSQQPNQATGNPKSQNGFQRSSGKAEKGSFQPNPIDLVDSLLDPFARPPVQQSTHFGSESFKASACAPFPPSNFPKQQNHFNNLPVGQPSPFNSSFQHADTLDNLEWTQNKPSFTTNSNVKRTSFPSEPGFNQREFAFEKNGPKPQSSHFESGVSSFGANNDLASFWQTTTTTNQKKEASEPKGEIDELDSLDEGLFIKSLEEAKMQQANPSKSEESRGTRDDWGNSKAEKEPKSLFHDHIQNQTQITSVLGIKNLGNTCFL